MGKWNEGPPRPLFYSKLRFGVVTFHIHPAANQILHHLPLNILVQELCPWCFAQHAPPSCHRLFSLDHCLESQFAGNVDVNQVRTVQAICLNSHTNAPSSFISIWRFHVATISRPWVSWVRNVLSIYFPVSFLQNNSQTDTSKLIILLPMTWIETDAPNWKAVSPWSPPTTTWTLMVWLICLSNATVSRLWFLHWCFSLSTQCILPSLFHRR